MRISQEKQRRLAYVARRYYLEDQRQSDIARELGVSRPMVSRLLSEARALGVVEITVHDPEAQSAGLLGQLCRTSSLRGGVLVEEGEDNDATNQLLSRGAVEQLRQIGARRLGVGWGYLIGQLVTWLEANPQPESTVTDICPLVGNASIPPGTTRSNENVRLMAQQLGAAPHFLYLPAPAGERGGEAAALLHRGLRQICQRWEEMDTALVNIGDYPSSPDFASLVRYGSLLQRHRACGRMLVYYFNEEGTVIPVRPGLRHPDPAGAPPAVPQHRRPCAPPTPAPSPAGGPPLRLFHPSGGPGGGAGADAAGEISNICNRFTAYPSGWGALYLCI